MRLAYSLMTTAFTFLLIHKYSDSISFVMPLCTETHCWLLLHKDSQSTSSAALCLCFATFQLTGEIFSCFVHNTSAVLAHVMYQHVKTCNDMRITRSRITNM